MSFVERLRNRFMRAKAAPGSSRRRVTGPAADWIWTPSPAFDTDLAWYAYNEWVSTAIDRMSEICASGRLQLVDRGTSELVSEHPLLTLLGFGGRPNRYQGAIDFWESHFQRLDVHGNDIWYLYSEFGGSPSEIYQLDPRYVTVHNVGSELVYRYRGGGVVYDLPAGSVLHFKRTNLQDAIPIWGISALKKLEQLIRTDMQMVRWNSELFGTGAPNGILIVDADYVSESDALSIEDRFLSRRNDDRRMVVVRARAGAGVWQDANLRPRDMDFSAGRLLNRQAVFDAFGFHVGLVSEASTEAHARVAERLVRSNAHFRQLRSASVMQTLLDFWPGGSRLSLRFEDVRGVDWDQESKKLESVKSFMTINEVRSRFLDLPPLSGSDIISGGEDVSATD